MRPHLLELIQWQLSPRGGLGARYSVLRFSSVVCIMRGFVVSITLGQWFLLTCLFLLLDFLVTILVLEVFGPGIRSLESLMGPLMSWRIERASLAVRPRGPGARLKR